MRIGLAVVAAASALAAGLAASGAAGSVPLAVLAMVAAAGALARRTARAPPPSRSALVHPHPRPIGVGRPDWVRAPLPPNRAGGSPAHGSPVDGFTSRRIERPRHGRLPD